jgi:propionyl-CoA carboxylase beta chain
MAISKELLDDLSARREAAIAGGGQDKADARREKGLMTARDRIDRLFEPDTFQEMGTHAEHNTRGFGMEEKSLPGDGVVTGIGYVDGRPVAGFSQDFTVAGGSLGQVHATKICDVMDYAGKTGMPIVGFNDSGGARIQEGVESLAGYARVFNRNVMMSGVVPQIAVVSGPCAGGAAYSPALMDFIVMTKTHANLFICGPDVIKTVTGETTTMDEIGSAHAHSTTSGNIHFVAEDDADATRIVHRLLSFLPSNNMMDPPHQLGAEVSLDDDDGMNDLVPEHSHMPLDVLKVILRLVDDGDFMESQAEFAGNIIVGFGRIQGIVVGIIANQPKVKAGTLDIDASDKGARFIRFCNAFGIPLVTLVDVPGFLPGVAQEKGGIIRHGAKMLFAYGSATVPKVTVVLRKAYGGAYVAMCSKDMGADMVFAWPSAEIAVMGAEGAINILYRREIKAAEDPAAMAEELATEYRDRFASPYQSAAKTLITDVIEPSHTRAAVGLALLGLLTKRETRPPKKHGNIPL